MKSHREPRIVRLLPLGFLGAMLLLAGAREARADLISLLAAYVNGTGGVHGLNGALGGVMSPDGSHLYVGSQDDAPWWRSAATPRPGS
jgi:hypothetical protein